MIAYTTTQARSIFSDLVNQVKYGKKIIAIGKKKSDGIQGEVLLVPYPDLDIAEIPIAKINAASPSFDFLADEPDIYSLADLKVSYV